VSFSRISCSANLCLALSNAGQLYQFTKDKLDFNKITQISGRIISFSASSTHCLCLDEFGVVWKWGELGLGDINIR
jgi:alpha-tubulin suppressor-like RCC1 family protein